MALYLFAPFLQVSVMSKPHTLWVYSALRFCACCFKLVGIPSWKYETVPTRFHDRFAIHLIMSSVVFMPNIPTILELWTKGPTLVSLDRNKVSQKDVGKCVSVRWIQGWISSSDGKPTKQRWRSDRNLTNAPEKVNPSLLKWKACRPLLPSYCHSLLT